MVSTALMFCCVPKYYHLRGRQEFFYDVVYYPLITSEPVIFHFYAGKFIIFGRRSDAASFPFELSDTTKKKVFYLRRLGRTLIYFNLRRRKKLGIINKNNRFI